MPEPTITPPATPTPVPAPTPAAATPPAPEPDLITKVAQFKKTEPAAPVDNGVDIGFDYKQLETIKDPAARKWAEDAYKSMQAGATKKFQEASQIKKEAEAKLTEFQAKTRNWTPERIQQELLNNPEFLQAAQQISAAQQQPDNNDSVLSEEEKAKMSRLESEIMNLKQSSYQSLISQQDSVLKSRYSDYDAQKVDEAVASLSRMSPHELREYVYKAIQHDDHVKNGYELGRQESLKLNQQKVNGFSVEGVSTPASPASPKKEPGESDRNFILRLYQMHKAQQKR